MNKVIFTILLHFSASLQCQTMPLDTSYYLDQTYKSIKYLKGKRFNSPTIRTFKKSLNPLDQNQPDCDTMYHLTAKKSPDWTKPNGHRTIYLHNRSHIYILEGQNNQGAKSGEITGIYHFLFPEINNLEVTINYNRDTSISGFSVAQFDTIKNAYKNIFYSTRFKSARFSEDYQVFSCGDLGAIEIYFSETNTLKSLAYFPNDTSKLAIHYEFHENLRCKEYGVRISNVKIKEWFEYYDNGNLKAIGTYRDLIPSTPEKEYRCSDTSKLYYIKHGKWKHFTKEGQLIFTEDYLNGQLTEK